MTDESSISSKVVAQFISDLKSTDVPPAIIQNLDTLLRAQALTEEAVVALIESQGSAEADASS